MDREGIYFFHIPKTAGMSVWHFLEQAFPPDEICPWWLWDQLITVPREELGKWRVFRGHFLSHLEPYLGKPLATFTFLRDPLERSISHYCHVRRDPNHPYHSHAVQMSLAEFCVQPETRHMIENYQAVYLANSPRDPMSVAGDLSPERLAQFELQVRLEHPDGILNPATLFEHAKARLASFFAIGCTEDFVNSVKKISYAFHRTPPVSIDRQNVNPEPLSSANLDSATRSLIRNLTEVDRRLYEWAISQLS
ncbi:MAG TPA: hypothetical protein VF283_09855 [Bryobacteraceae bacterium]